MSTSSELSIRPLQQGCNGEDFIRMHGHEAVLDWFPESGVAHLRLSCRRMQVQNVQIFHTLLDVIDDRQQPYCLFFRAQGIEWVSLSARQDVAATFARSKAPVQLWAYGASPTLYVVAKMFLRVTKYPGGVSHTLDEAKASTGLCAWQPEPLEPADS